MKSKLLLLTLSLLTMLTVPLLAQTSYPAGSEPTVTTDKDDYQPGDIAVFTGTGWTLDTSVTIVLEETPYQGHDEVFFVMVEPDGSWEVKFPIDIKHLGVEFHLLATGGNSGYVAEAFFTDGAYVFNAAGLPIGKSITVNLTNAPTSFVTFTTPNSSASNTSNNNTIITFAFDPNPIQSNINYVILNYTNIRTQTGGGPGGGNSTTIVQTENNFNAESNNVSRIITANYGALVSTDVSAIYGSNSVTLTSAFYSNYQTSTGIAGKTITFYLNGVAVGTTVTDASGVASLTLDLTSVPTLGKLSVGTYDITTSFAGDTGLLAVPNENSTGSVLTVEQKSASVTPDANTKEYGSADPALTGTLEGFLAADNVTAVYTRASGETVLGGPYTISAELSPVEVLSNYDITYNTADFEITPRAVTVTANDFEKFTGQENPTFSVTYSGFVNDEDEEDLDGELEFETDADRSSCAGSYLITPSGLTSSNYDITFVKGTLTVKPVHIDAIESSAPIQIETSGTLKATVTADEVPVEGVFVEFFINGVSQGTAETDADGKASKQTATMNDAGLFNLKASVGDYCAVSEVILTVFDPSGGFVTGGGWINSPAGALKADPSKEGSANYGFNAKYKSGKNQNEVDGNLEFNFQVGNFNFKSTSMDNMSLTVSGHLATFTGKGRVNNVDGFSIFVSILDEALSDSFTTDKIRIRVTDSSGNVVYDNNITNTNLTAIPETEIGGGNIVIHTPPAKGKGKKVTISELIEVPWNTPIDEIMNILNELSAEWTASGEISEITWKIDDYNAIQPGYYEVVGEYYNQATFAMMEPVYVPVIVMDKALPESITISKESISPMAKLGEVIGTLGTIDPADDVHTYRLEGTDMLTIQGDQLIWNGSGLVPNGISFTLFSMDRMGNEISREITLSREVDSNSILIYPNPAKTETNILIQLSEESVVGIKVFDASGRVILEEQSVHSETFVKYLDLQGYSSGLYHVVVQIGNRVLSGRLVKDL